MCCRSAKNRTSSQSQISTPHKAAGKPVMDSGAVVVDNHQKGQQPGQQHAEVDLRIARDHLEVIHRWLHLWDIMRKKAASAQEHRAGVSLIHVLSIICKGRCASADLGKTWQSNKCFLVLWLACSPRVSTKKSAACL